MQLGLMGGTFNPIHMAHLRIAEEAREQCGLEQVLFIPAADPPHKPLAGDLAFADRLEMVKLATRDNPVFSVSDMEAQRGGKSYTVETLKTLRTSRSQDELSFIIGSDSFLELGLWYNYQEIFHLSSLIVVERPGSEISEPLQQLPQDVRQSFIMESGRTLRHESGSSIQFVSGTRLDIASTRIRSILASGRSIRYLVPESVERFITQKGLYLK
jgi:nicotinate-nucleotide adenylyltransferase